MAGRVDRYTTAYTNFCRKPVGKPKMKGMDKIRMHNVTKTRREDVQWLRLAQTCVRMPGFDVGGTDLSGCAVECWALRD